MDLSQSLSYSNFPNVSFSGCTVFAVLGNYAHELGVENVGKVVDGGAGLTFIAYPTAIANLPVPQLFSVLFFLMFVTLGLGSVAGLIANIVSLICDSRTSWNKLLVTAIVCTFGFLLGLIYVTPVSIVISRTMFEIQSSIVQSQKKGVPVQSPIDEHV